MTLHLFGNIITRNAIAANNRGENDGNTTLLQKVFWNGTPHVTVSSEAIRWAMRYYWQYDSELLVNRKWYNDNGGTSDFPITFDESQYIDDDVMGYMYAGKGKGTVTQKRRGALDVSRAISLEPATKIVQSFNSRSGNKEAKDGDNLAKTKTSLYSTEMLGTEFQYGFGITPSKLSEPSRIVHVLNSIANIGNVAGNHARFFYDFSPLFMVLRWTHEPAPKILNCCRKVYKRGHDEPIYDFSTLESMVKCEEIDPSELWVLGGVPGEFEGANCFPSVRKGIADLTGRILKDLG